MLTHLFENLLVSLINLLTRNAGRPAMIPGLNRGTALPPDSDPPVLIGTTIPSAREALRQGGAVPAAVYLTTERRSHMVYVTGKTGFGKSNLNMLLIDADVEAGRGVCCLDYRGDMVDRILQRLAARHSPEALAERLLLYDLRAPGGGDGADAGGVVPFNPLAECGANPYASAFLVLDVFRQILGTGLGVQTEETLRNVLLGLAMTRGSLLDVEPVLTCEAARRRMLAGVSDHSVLRFFARFEAVADRGAWVNPILNKISPWTATPTLKRFFGAEPATSLRDFLDGRPDAIVLFCAGADEHFGGTAALVTNLFANAVAAAVMRTGRPARHGLFCFVDECQNLVSEKFAEMLSEGRKFGLWLTLSHQSPGQLDPRLRALVRNVVGTSVFFAAGGADAEALAAEIGSDEPKAVMRNLLINQGVGEAVLVRGGGAPAVRIRTPHVPDPAVAPEALRSLRRASLGRHGSPAADVDREIREREAAWLPAPAPPQPAPGGKAGRSRKRPPGGNGAPGPPDSQSTREYEVRDCDGREGYGYDE